MDRKQVGKILKRIKEIDKTLKGIDQKGLEKSAEIQRIQQEVNQLMNRKVSILGGAIELNRLLPEKDQLDKYKSEEEKPQEEPEDEAPDSGD